MDFTQKKLSKEGWRDKIQGAFRCQKRFGFSSESPKPLPNSLFNEAILHGTHKNVSLFGTRNKNHSNTCFTVILVHFKENMNQQPNGFTDSCQVILFQQRNIPRENLDLKILQENLDLFKDTQFNSDTS